MYDIHCMQTIHIAQTNILFTWMGRSDLPDMYGNKAWGCRPKS